MADKEGRWLEGYDSYDFMRLGTRQAIIISPFDDGTPYPKLYVVIDTDDLGFCVAGRTDGGQEARNLAERALRGQG